MVKLNFKMAVSALFFLVFGALLLTSSCESKTASHLELLPRNLFLLRFECAAKISVLKLSSVPPNAGLGSFHYKCTVKSESSEEIELEFPPARFEIAGSYYKSFHDSSGMEWKINGEPLESSKRVVVKPGDTLVFEFTLHSSWRDSSKLRSFQYLTFVFGEGKVNGEPVTIGSISTYPVVWE